MGIIDKIMVNVELEGLEKAKAEVKELNDSTLLLKDNLEKVKDIINGMKTDILSIVNYLEDSINEEQELAKLGEGEQEYTPELQCKDGVCHINFE